MDGFIIAGCQWFSLKQRDYFDHDTIAILESGDPTGKKTLKNPLLDQGGSASSDLPSLRPTSKFSSVSLCRVSRSS